MSRVIAPERVALEDQIRECYGRTVYTHKTHEKAADILEARRDRYKVLLIILTGLSALGVLSVLFVDEKIVEIAAAVLAFLSFFASTYLKDIDPGAAAAEHRQAAVKIWDIRETYLSLLSDFADITNQEVRERRNRLQAEYRGILEQAPSTNSAAYAKAQKGLKNNEELFFEERELDLLLPEALRRG